MIFEPTVCRQILSGRKTQARILIKPGELAGPVKKGRTVAIQPAVGRRAFGRARIVDVYQEQLGEITYQGARAEGFKTRDEFFDDWRGRHPGTIHDDGTNLVWVIVLSLEADEPHLLTPASRPKGSVHGYTSNPGLAMRGIADPGEALTDSQLRELTKYRPAVASERRTRPLLDAADRIARELDQMQVELRTGSYSQQAKRTVRLLRQKIGVLERQL